MLKGFEVLETYLARISGVRWADIVEVKIGRAHV